MQRLPNINQTTKVYLIPRGIPAPNNMTPIRDNYPQYNTLEGSNIMDSTIGTGPQYVRSDHAQEYSTYQTVWMPSTSNVQYQTASNHISYNSVATMPYGNTTLPMITQNSTQMQESRNPSMQYSLQPRMQQYTQRNIQQPIQQPLSPLPMEQTTPYTMQQQPMLESSLPYMQQTIQQPSVQQTMQQSSVQQTIQHSSVQQTIQQPSMLHMQQPMLRIQQPMPQIQQPMQQIYQPMPQIQQPMQQIHQAMQHSAQAPRQNQFQQPMGLSMQMPMRSYMQGSIQPTTENYSRNGTYSPLQYESFNDLTREFSSSIEEFSLEENNPNDNSDNNINNSKLPPLDDESQIDSDENNGDSGAGQPTEPPTRISPTNDHKLERFLGFLDGTARNPAAFERSEIKYEELIYLAVNGSSIASQLAITHRSKPCFYQIENVCKRLMTDILRPISPQVEHQGSAWAVKDFIFVFTRIMNAWMIIKGYINNNHSGLHNIKAEFSPELAASFTAWENSSLVFCSNVIKTFINLNNLVQKEENLPNTNGNNNENLESSQDPIPKTKIDCSSPTDEQAESPTSVENVELNASSITIELEVASNVMQLSNDQQMEIQEQEILYAEDSKPNMTD